MDHNRFSYTPMPLRPHLALPKGARIAVWVIPNVEYFPFDLPATAINPGLHPFGSRRPQFLMA